jgi:hypothetical protein
VRPKLHQVERHEPVVDLLKRGSGELQHVDLDPVGAEVVLERLDQLAEVVAVVEGAVDEVGADDAEGLLLEDRLLVPHPACRTISLGSPLGSAWKRNPSQPWASFVALVVAGRHRVREHEEIGPVPPGGREPLDQELVLVVEHQLEPPRET